MVLSCGLVYVCIVYVNPVMLLRCNLYCTKFSDPDISVRIVTTERLYHDTSAPAVAGVALGGGGPHGHPGNIKPGGLLAFRNNVRK